MNDIMITADQALHKPLNIAVLFDGAGLARLGLEQAGHRCTGFEKNPVAHHLSRFVGSGRSVLADVRDVDLSSFDAVWASPPCQDESQARTQGPAAGPYTDNLLDWALDIRTRWPHLQILWVECVGRNAYGRLATWGRTYNAAQFGGNQNRNRCIGGHYPPPITRVPWAKYYPGLAPAVLASEAQGHANDKRRASRYFGRRATLDEVAALQGFTIPPRWLDPLPGYRMSGPRSSWSVELYKAIGNGVPVHMARAFGMACHDAAPAQPAANDDPDLFAWADVMTS